MRSRKQHLGMRGAEYIVWLCVLCNYHIYIYITPTHASHSHCHHQAPPLQPPCPHHGNCPPPQTPMPTPRPIQKGRRGGGGLQHTMRLFVVVLHESNSNGRQSSIEAHVDHKNCIGNLLESTCVAIDCCRPFVLFFSNAATSDACLGQLRFWLCCVLQKPCMDRGGVHLA